jgi:hypothetical protein
MGKKVQAAAHGDDLWSDGMGEVAEGIEIKGIAIDVNRGGVGGQPV